MCYGLNAFLSRNSFAQRHPSLSTMNNTPEEIILCAVLWLFRRRVEAVHRQLRFRLVSPEWIKSVPNQCQEKGSRVVWARDVSSSTSTTLFSEWLGNKLYIFVYIWEKERSGKETDGCYQSWGWQSALKETFLPLVHSPHASHSCAEILSGACRWGSESLILQFACRFCTCCLMQWNAAV